MVRVVYYDMNEWVTVCWKSNLSFTLEKLLYAWKHFLQIIPCCHHQIALLCWWLYYFCPTKHQWSLSKRMQRAWGVTSKQSSIHACGVNLFHIQSNGQQLRWPSLSAVYTLHVANSTPYTMCFDIYAKRASVRYNGTLAMIVACSHLICGSLCSTKLDSQHSTTTRLV